MATTQTINSTYAGADSGKYFSAAVKAADTIEKGAISVLPNVKFKSILHRLEVANGQKNFACDFVPVGSVSLSERALEPKKLMINLELCKENYVQTWEAESMGFGANNGNLPASFQEYFIAKVLEGQAAKLDSDIWSGTDIDGSFAGVLGLTGMTEITATSAITATNVIAELGRVYDAIPDELIGKEDLKMVVSGNVARAYKRALSALGFRLDYTVGDKPLDFEGIELVVIGGLPASTMLAYQVSNVWFGTGLLEDHNQLIIKDMSDTDLSDNIRFKMVFTAGVEVIVPSEIVAYKQ